MINFENAPSKLFTFVLTHFLDKKLITNAILTVGDVQVWKLDFKNGQVITYTIVSMNEDNFLCGTKAIDSLGDTCDICITKLTGDDTSVEFKYKDKRATYKGYLLR